MTKERRNVQGRRADDMEGLPLCQGWLSYRDNVRRIYKLVIVVLVIAGIALLASLATYANGRDDDAKANQTRKQLIGITQDIKSCTTPEGECSKRGATNGANISAAITYCTLNLPFHATRDTVKNCIVKELEIAP